METAPSLCSPGFGLGCFACCPPIRPPGYDHAYHRGSLRRLFVESTALISAGQLPQRPMLGFWCPGLGFLDAAGRQIGCLLHPARHHGRDLRGPTGYAAKCARESCPPARAFGQLPPLVADRLAGACQGMDSFVFSSRRLNPLHDLLAFGPDVALAVAHSGPVYPDDLAALPWLRAVDPALGWPLAGLAQLNGPDFVRRPAVVPALEALAARLRAVVGPLPPRDEGAPLRDLADQWEARFWRWLSGRVRAREAELQKWRRAAEQALAALIVD